MNVGMVFVQSDFLSSLELCPKNKECFSFVFCSAWVEKLFLGMEWEFVKGDERNQWRMITERRPTNTGDAEGGRSRHKRCSAANPTQTRLISLILCVIVILFILLITPIDRYLIFMCRVLESIPNKHSEVLMSCSDRLSWNFMDALFGLSLIFNCMKEEKKKEKFSGF